VGGSLYRIHRDTRFSRDKSPYKLWAALHFRHEAGKDVHAPGFYLHLQPDHVFLGVGIWHPDAPTLAMIRDAIVDRPDHWKRAITAKRFSSTFNLAGDSLKRAPRGYDPEHPYIDDLKRKDFIAVANLTQAQLYRPDFLDRFSTTAGAAKPFVRFLAASMGLPF
jgi:uncharacterized protein (TIGR02453 family)